MKQPCHICARLCGNEKSVEDARRAGPITPEVCVRVYAMVVSSKASEALGISKLLNIAIVFDRCVPVTSVDSPGACDSQNQMIQ